MCFCMLYPSLEDFDCISCQEVIGQADTLLCYSLLLLLLQGRIQDFPKGVGRGGGGGGGEEVYKWSAFSCTLINI